MEWKQILIEDVVFLLHEVQNDGSMIMIKLRSVIGWKLCGGNGDCQMMLLI